MKIVEYYIYIKIYRYTFLNGGADIYYTYRGKNIMGEFLDSTLHTLKKPARNEYQVLLAATQERISGTYVYTYSGGGAAGRENAPRTYHFTVYTSLSISWANSSRSMLAMNVRLIGHVAHESIICICTILLSGHLHSCVCLSFYPLLDDKSTHSSEKRIFFTCSFYIFVELCVCVCRAGFAL